MRLKPILQRAIGWGGVKALEQRTSPTWAMPPMRVPTMSSTMLASVQNCGTAETSVFMTPKYWCSLRQGG